MTCTVGCRCEVCARCAVLLHERHTHRCIALHVSHVTPVRTGCMSLHASPRALPTSVSSSRMWLRTRPLLRTCTCHTPTPTRHLHNYFRSQQYARDYESDGRQQTQQKTTSTSTSTSTATATATPAFQYPELKVALNKLYLKGAHRMGWRCDVM